LDEPQIRVGSNFHKISDDLIATYYINRETVNCEAIINTFDKSSPNGVQWFNNQLDLNFELPFSKITVESDIVNFTSKFSLIDVFVPLEIYKCCTTFDEKPVKCLSVNLTQNSATTTETSTTEEMTTSIILTTLINSNNTTRHVNSKSSKGKTFSFVLYIFLNFIFKSFINSE
jgi:hypothetical protein